eukprot:UN02087
MACCNEVEDLKTYIQTAEACSRLKGRDDFVTMMQDTEFSKFIYLRNLGTTGPELSHCVDQNADAHIPENSDNWWSYLMLGYVNCTLQINPNINKYHISNEPNTKYYRIKGYDGSYYANFFYNVSTLIRSHFPKLLFSGPVTNTPPSAKTLWKKWYILLFDKVFTTNPDLLNYIDYHAYNGVFTDGKKSLTWANWDVDVANVHVVSIYYQIRTKNLSTARDKNIRTVLTETNWKLTDAQGADRDVHWKHR